MLYLTSTVCSLTGNSIKKDRMKMSMVAFAFFVLFHATCIQGQYGEDPCSPNPCVNGGQCLAGSCTCIDGYSGNTCEIEAYVQLENGPGCGEASITTAEECGEAAGRLGYPVLVTSVSDINAPLGCFAGHPVDNWSHTFFNTQDGATGNANYRSICKNGCFDHNSDYSGFDLAILAGVASKDDCQLVCQNTPGCQAFTYATNEYSNPEIRGKCFAKEVKGTVTSTGATYGLISGPATCPGCFQQNTNMPGNDLRFVDNVESAERCKDRCLHAGVKISGVYKYFYNTWTGNRYRRGPCDHFTYVTTDYPDSSAHGRCYLKLATRFWSVAKNPGFLAGLTSGSNNDNLGGTRQCCFGRSLGC